MHSAQNGGFFNPNRGAQIFEELQDPAKRYYNVAERELPEGTVAQLVQEDVTISLPRDTALQAHRMFGRFVLSKEAPNHINPGDPEAETGRLNQFAVKASFVSKRLEGYRASISVRVTARSSDSRRRESSQPKLFLCARATSVA